jgi:hypothetical protein
MTKQEILATIPIQLIKQWDIKIDEPIICDKYHLTINSNDKRTTSIDIDSIKKIDLISPLFISIHTKNTTTYIATHSNHTIILDL